MITKKKYMLIPGQTQTPLTIKRNHGTFAYNINERKSSMFARMPRGDEKKGKKIAKEFQTRNWVKEFGRFPPQQIRNLWRRRKTRRRRKRGRRKSKKR